MGMVTRPDFPPAKKVQITDFFVLQTKTLNIMKKGEVLFFLAIVFLLAQVYDSYGQPLNPNSAPNANFKGHKKHRNVGETVHFTDLSSHCPTSWHWYFEGGEPAESTIENPHNILYNLPGSYDVTLIVANQYGTDTLTKSGYIDISSPGLPISKFCATRRYLLPGESTSFKDKSKNDPSSWSWFFPGGEPAQSDEEDPEGIVYNEAGSYDVTLVVSNEMGSNTLTKYDYITICDTVLCEPPIAGFEASSNEVMIGQVVAFSDMSENDVDEWYWLFEAAMPGQATGNGPVNVVYDSIGVYDATLVVVNDCGIDTLTMVDYITVVDTLPLRSDYIANKTNVIEGDLVKFTDLSAGDPTFWEWHIEGASPSVSYSQNPSVIFHSPGVYAVTLTVYEWDQSDIEIKEGYISVEEEVLILPPGWEYEITPFQHAIAIPTYINPNILGFPLEAGDHVGVFFTDENDSLKCGGIEVWNGQTNMAVVALGDSPFTAHKDGFSFGEEFIWKIYSWGMEQEFDAISSYDTSLVFQNTFYPMGLSALSDLTAIIRYDLTIPGGWSGLSCPVFPLNPAIMNVLTPIMDQLILLNNFYGLIWPGAGINTFEFWDNLSGYNIKMNDYVTLSFIGVSNSDAVISVEAGWNFMPVPVFCEKDINELLGSNVEHVRVIRETSGFKVFWPEFNYYTLNTLVPGRSYLLLAEEDFDIYFPACENFKGNNNSDPFENVKLTNQKWNDVQSTNTVHNLVVTAEASSILKINDQIGVFTQNGHCSGFAEFNGKNMVLSVFGDDVTTVIEDGQTDGELMQLMLFRPSDGSVFELSPEYDQSAPNQQWYSNNGISVIKDLKISSTGIGDMNTEEVYVRYDRTNTSLTITGISEAQQISILSSTGKIVLHQEHRGSNSALINVSHQAQGVYILLIEGDGTPVVKKIIL
jgi:PKD repeat protein